VYKTYIETLGYKRSTRTTLPKIIKDFLCYIEQSEISNKEKTADYGLPTADTKDIENYINHIETRPNKRNKDKGLSTSYIKHHIYAIKHFYKYLELIEIIKINPSTGINYNKKIEINQRKILSRAEIRRLFETAETLTETSILHLAYSLGMRRNEIENLELRDIDFYRNIVYVRSGKHSKRRAIPMTWKVKEDLKCYKNNERIETAEKAFLLNKRGEKMQGDTIYTIFKTLINKASLSHEISLHNLRHSIATHLLHNGMKVEMVREFLGHNQLKSTQIYTRIQCDNLIISQ
jgi:integrase/recombinase XerD